MALLKDRYQKLIGIVAELKDSIAHTDYSVDKALEHMNSLKNVLESGYSSAGTLSSIKWVIKKRIINFSKYLKQKVIGFHTIEN